MNALIQQLLLQIRCAYCGKALSQDIERRLGQLSLCPDCFYHIIGAHAKVHSTADSKPLSVANSTALSKRKFGTFNKRDIHREKSSLSTVDSRDFRRDVIRDFLRYFHSFYRRLRK